MAPMADAQLHWRGGGSSRDGVQFCVSSTTGRYTLVIASSNGRGLQGATHLPYSVRLESDGHAQDAIISSTKPTAIFEGRVSSDRDCEQGPNARLVIGLDGKNAMAANAGAYSDQVSLMIEPR